MIISHKYRFIFLKTRKTAGTSIEVWLSQHCAASDIVTPVEPTEAGHLPRNHEGIFNPLPELAQRIYAPTSIVTATRRTTGDWLRRRRFYNHITAELVRARIPHRIWRDYWKWCVERTPEEKVLSDFYMQQAASPGLEMEEYLGTYPLPVNYPIYCNSSGMPIVDQIVDYGQLQIQLQEIANRFGIPFQGLSKAKANYRPKAAREMCTLSVSQSRFVAEKFAVECSILRRFNHL